MYDKYVTVTHTYRSSSLWFPLLLQLSRDGIFWTERKIEEVESKEKKMWSSPVITTLLLW
jgi:hypothetical protein